MSSSTLFKPDSAGIDFLNMSRTFVGLSIYRSSLWAAAALGLDELPRQGEDELSSRSYFYPIFMVFLNHVTLLTGCSSSCSTSYKGGES